MELQPRQPTVKGPAEWFTGDVWIDGIVRGEEPSRVRVSAVRFTPSARTAWHSHAVGQTLYVTEGQGLALPTTIPLAWQGALLPSDYPVSYGVFSLLHSGLTLLRYC